MKGHGDSRQFLPFAFWASENVFLFGLNQDPPNVRCHVFWWEGTALLPFADFVCFLFWERKPWELFRKHLDTKVPLICLTISEKGILRLSMTRTPEKRKTWEGYPSIC